MKIYKGKRLRPEQGTASNVKVTVEEGGKEELLRHHVRHSPTGMNWGYGGSGPADLALSILWDYLKAEPAPGCYQDFKHEFVADWEEEWEITEREITEWLVKRQYRITRTVEKEMEEKEKEDLINKKRNETLKKFWNDLSHDLICYNPSEYGKLEEYYKGYSAGLLNAEIIDIYEHIEITEKVIKMINHQKAMQE